MTTTSNTPQPKLVADQIFERFTKFASELLDSFAEPNAVTLVVDWNVGQHELPAGLLFTRNKDAPAHELLAMLQQLNRMGERLAQVIDESIINAAKLSDKLTDELNAKKTALVALLKEVEELEQRKRQLREAAAGTAGCPEPQA